MVRIMTCMLLILFPLSGLYAQDSSFYQKKDSWSKIVDEFWGAGDPLAGKQDIFNAYADRLEKKYPLFAGLGMDWDSLRSTYYGRITESTSKGAFSALMTHFGYEFRELHTRIWDLTLEKTIPLPGTPIFYLNAFSVAHFGASITTLEDNSLVVVNVVNNHPMDLEPGDIILGYEGVPWADLSAELFESGIPLGGWLGSTKESINYMKMTNAGMNWHLFSTIDIVKYSSGDTIHLSTDLFSSFPQTEPIFNNPQIEVDGVSQPDLAPDHPYGGVSSGKITGTNIGYIYVTKHNYQGVNGEFGAAVSGLMDTDGLIIDLRWNSGGFQQLFDGMSLLFNFNFKPLQILFRCSEEDLYSLCPSNFPYWFNWDQNDPETSYDKPIAVLIGPNAESFGDIFARTMEFHPSARFFGRPTNGAFAGQLSSDALNIEGWSVTAPDFTMSNSENDTVSRARSAVQPDDEVWLTREDIANRHDTVVDRALEWINTTAVNPGPADHLAESFSLDQNYPNPFNPSTIIEFQIPNSEFTTLKVYNVLGEEVSTLVSGELIQGNHTYSFDGRNLASGIYYYQLVAGEYREVKKMILLR